MLKSTSKALLGLFLATASTHALAQTGAWQVSEANGDVQVRHGGTIKAARRGMVVTPGDAVVTRANSRAVLVHNNDFVTVSSDSQVRVPGEPKPGSLVQMIEDWGSAIFRIEKQGKPHFAVDTPYLAAVVKGTTFSVTVGTTGTSLQVVEGVVEVATVDGGARDLIRPGAVAMILAADRYRLQISGDRKLVIDSPRRAAARATPISSQQSGAGSSEPEPASQGDEPTSSAADAPAMTAELLTASTPIYGGPSSAAVGTIGDVIIGKPGDLGSITGGLVTGSPTVQLASVTTGAATSPAGRAAPDTSVPTAGPTPPSASDPAPPLATSPTSPPVTSPTPPATDPTPPPATAPTPPATDPTPPATDSTPPVANPTPPPATDPTPPITDPAPPPATGPTPPATDPTPPVTDPTPPPTTDPTPPVTDPTPPAGTDPAPPKNDPKPPKDDPKPPKDDPKPPKDDPKPPKDDPKHPKDDPKPPKDDPKPPKEDPKPPKNDPTPPSDAPTPPKDDPTPPKSDPNPPKDDPTPPKNDPKPPKDNPKSPKADTLTSYPPQFDAPVGGSEFQPPANISALGSSQEYGSGVLESDKRTLRFGENPRLLPSDR